MKCQTSLSVKCAYFRTRANHIEIQLHHENNKIWKTCKKAAICFDVMFMIMRIIELITKENIMTVPHRYAIENQLTNCNDSCPLFLDRHTIFSWLLCLISYKNRLNTFLWPIGIAIHRFKKSRIEWSIWMLTNYVEPDSFNVAHLQHNCVYMFLSNFHILYCKMFQNWCLLNGTRWWWKIHNIPGGSF